MNNKNKIHSFFILSLGCLLMALQLTGCSSVGKHRRYTIDQDTAPKYNIDVSNIPDATPKEEAYSKYGNPSSYNVLGRRYHLLKTSNGYCERGIASWYGMKFQKHRTSSGEMYDLAKMSAAHKTLPIPCYAKVTNLNNQKYVIVKINDRGPFHENRIIDLSYVAAKKLGVLGTGTALVEVETIDPRHPEQVRSTTIKTFAGKPKLYLQIGAFAQENNAQRAKTSIARYTHASIHIVEGLHGGQTIYRVRIGPLENVDSSDALHHALLKEKLGEPMTVIQ